LQRVDLAGGTPLTRCEVTVPPPAATGAAWGIDGRILIGSVAAGLVQVPAAGGTPSPLTTLNRSRREVSHRWPQILPGGRFLYFAESLQPEDSGLYVASFAKPNEAKRVLPSGANAVFASLSDGRGFLFSLREQTLMAQELDLNTLHLIGELIR
jgi:eukaryotic-like serine/threonine-protein kinase